MPDPLFSRLAVWPLVSRPDQVAPSGEWSTWLLLGGRGAGKTRTGAEWINARVRAGAGRIALVAPTLHDARTVMVEGESGLLSTAPCGWRPQWKPSLRQLTWRNGAVAHVFSAEDPDALRGPQFDTAWCDEFCAWRNPRDTLSNLRMGLRLGSDARMVMTTTPRPSPALKTLMERPCTRTSRAGTADNTGLAKAFRDTIESLYGGTTLGRQELQGEIVEDASGALWSRATLEGCIGDTPDEFARIVVAVDPPVTSGKRADACGVIVAGLDDYGTVHILDDATCQGLTPAAWAGRVAARYAHWQADCVVVETNQGGELVEDVLLRAEPTLPVRRVHASRSKRARAEPIAILYEQGRVRHARVFPELEDELNRIGTRAQVGSPDRADALVWAVASLASGHGGPSIRVL